MPEPTQAALVAQEWAVVCPDGSKVAVLSEAFGEYDRTRLDATCSCRTAPHLLVTRTVTPWQVIEQGESDV